MRSQCNNVLRKEISIEFRKQDIYIFEKGEKKFWGFIRLISLRRNDISISWRRKLFYLSRISIKERFAK